MSRKDGLKDKRTKFKLGQYFTDKEVVTKTLDLIFNYRELEEDIDILEPSFGTGNFIEELSNRGFDNIYGCEIDESLYNDKNLDVKILEDDFFKLPLDKKFDLIIGNPPFTKYNLEESYFDLSEYRGKGANLYNYLPQSYLEKKKVKIENAFIFKSIRHLKDSSSILAFVLPISFFIREKNKKLKNYLKKNFSTIIVYQNNEPWFEYDIPCCFAVFTNIVEYVNDIILMYENEENISINLDLEKLVTSELIPQTYLYKEGKSLEGKKLSEFLKSSTTDYKKSYEENNINASNILENTEIPEKNVENYKLAVCRVGNASVGRASLINIKEDVLNDMFYVFEFKNKYKNEKEIKELVCNKINDNQGHFKKITQRVGSKSIKKRDILDFRIKT